MRLTFRIALRFLKANIGQTVLIALGIAIGISVQVFIGSLIEGLQNSLVDATIGRSPHITVAPAARNERLGDFPGAMSVLNDKRPDIIALTPTLTQPGFLLYKDQFDQMLFRGFELDKANDIYRFNEALLPGSRMPVGAEVLIGVARAQDGGIAIGDSLTLISADRVQREVVVAGIFDLKVAALNSSWVIGDLALAQGLFSYATNEVSALEMQISSPFDADQLAAEIEQVLSPEYAVSNWKKDNEQLLSGLSGQSASSLMIQVFVVISVVLGIASVLAITVLQKSRQIGILKAMGLNDAASSQVFLFQGAVLGVLGGILGIVLGVGLVYAFSTFALNPDGTPVVPITINARFIILSGLIAVVAATGAAVVPALKSRTLSPIEVIRNA
jgi:lipoprotein-releasing system permease protein